MEKLPEVVELLVKDRNDDVNMDGKDDMSDEAE